MVVLVKKYAVGLDDSKGRGEVVSLKPVKIVSSIPERVLILDFGSQYTQVIARRIREAKVFSEIVPHTISAKKVDPPASTEKTHPRWIERYFI